MFSKKSLYALRALAYLSCRNRLVKIAEVSAEEKIPIKFLENILLELKNHGILHSERGKEGGYKLNRKASEITYGEVIGILDGPLSNLACMNHSVSSPCKECSNECHIKLLMTRISFEVSSLLNSTTLADAIKHKKSNENFL